MRVEDPERDLERTVTLSPIKLESHESWLPSEHPLHRPRHGTRQLAALLCAVVFFTVPVLMMAIAPPPTEFENRKLAPFPSPRDGWAFFSGLSSWAADHLPLRQAAIRAADGISRGIFGEPSPFDGQQNAGPSAPFAPQTPAGSAPGVLPEPPLAAGFAKVIEGKDGWLYYGFDVQGKCHPLRPMDEVINSLVRLRAAVETSGRRFILVVPPDKSTIVPEQLPDTYVGKSCAAAASAEFWRRVRSQAGAVDLLQAMRLITQVEGRPPYYQLDTHWDDRGVIMMVRQIAEHIQPGISAGWHAQPERTVENAADLPLLLGRSGTNTATLFSLAPDGDRDRTRQALDDLKTPVRFESAAGSGMVTASVGVLVDSFSLPATRYLPAAFSDIELVFYSSLATNPSDVMRVMVESEVVVLEVVERNLASGIAPVVDPAMVDRIAAELAKHPRG